MLLSSLRLLLLAPLYRAAASAALSEASESFHESLTLHPLPDGRLSVLFEFTTFFSAPSSSSGSSIPQSHHTLTPPSLLLPLSQNNVSELTISFVSGRWDQHRSSEAGPLHYQSSGGGGEVRGWLDDNSDQTSSAGERWNAVTHALGGLFCARLGPAEEGESITTFGGVYPPQQSLPDVRKHHLLSHPHTQLCTENLTPFLSLLPSKGLSGLSSLLAQPNIIFSWGFKAEGIEIIMPSSKGSGRWTGWWEGVVDLVPPKPKSNGKDKDKQRDFSLQRLFGRNVPRAFPEAHSSVLKIIKPPEQRLRAQPSGTPKEMWIDGKRRQVEEWDLLDERLVGNDISFSWDQDEFSYPREIAPPDIAITRTITDTHVSDGTFQISISNHGHLSREAVYSEIWPWWVKGWMSEISLYTSRETELELRDHKQPRPELLKSIKYHPSVPPKVSTTTLHFSLTLPAKSTLVLRIPFTKLTLKYTEHRPDAERGVEIPSGVLTLLDLVGENDVDVDGLPAPSSGAGAAAGDHDGNDNDSNPLKSGRVHIYSPRLLLDVPTPDFSMPYNVIIMSSTVMAVFFGLMQGSLTRRWGWVELPKKG